MKPQKKNVKEEDVSWFIKDWEHIRRWLWVFLIGTFFSSIGIMVRMYFVQQEMLKQQAEIESSMKEQSKIIYDMQIFIRTELIKQNK
jgi:hypothetical protein